MGDMCEEAMPPLAILNHPPCRLPGPELLHDLVSRSGKENAAAIEFRGSDGPRASLSYEQLHHQSDLLASKIQDSAQPLPESQPFIVPVLAPQGPLLYVALLSILKAGGAFCPLYLDAPPERVKFILRDVSASVVLCTSELVSRIPQDDPVFSILVLDEDNAEAQPDNAGAQPNGETCSVRSWRAARPADLAYVMYTSGSTGTPKGVGVSHSAATQSLLAHKRHIPDFSRFLQFAAPTFDVSVFEIFFPWLRGRTLVSCSRSEMLNDLPAVIRDMHVDACELTPTVAGSLLRKREDAPGLRLLLTIGEMLTRPVVEEFAGDEDEPSILWAMYGPTEAAIHCSLQPAFARRSAVGSIGFPLDTVSAFVLGTAEDDGGFPHVQRVGQVGELAVGGFQLASGYLNRPEQTSAAFVDSPYGPLYRTGDKVRFLPDGTMECLGRISEGQVKLRGQRLELGEVEQAALRTPGCHSALAAVVENILVLFCAVGGTDGTTTRIEETCTRWLPAFMVPGDVVLMHEFPRLPSGKTDRKRMVTDYGAARDQQQNGAALFRDSLERDLCQITTSCLGVETHPSTNLAMAGLDSIAAIRLSSALRQAFFDVSAVEVLGSRTVSQLGDAVRRRGVRTSPAPRTESRQGSPITVGKESIDATSPLAEHVDEIEELLLCTPLQVSMLAETASNLGAYCNWVEVAVPDASPDLITSWIFQIAQSNQVLRTGFTYSSGQFLQVLWKHLKPAQVATVDNLNRSPELGTEGNLLHPFRVQIGPPSCGERRILLHIHHSLYDGWTIDMLLADIGAVSGQERPPQRPQFREVLAFFHSDDYSRKCDLAKEFWAENLAGYQPAPFPQLMTASADDSRPKAKALTIDVDPIRLKDRFRKLEIGPQVLFQAALVWLWSSLLGSEDVVIGTVTSGRTIPVAGVEEIMGPCIAPVPLRVDISRVRTVKDLLVTIHAANRSALPHSVLPLSDIQRTCGILPGQPLYDVLFVYQESLYSHNRHRRNVREVGHQDFLETKVLLEIEPADRSVACRLTYHSDVVTADVAENLMLQLQYVIHHFVDGLDLELSSTSAVFPDSLLSLYNTKPETLSGLADIAMAVEAVAGRRPHKEAVCFAHSITDESVESDTITFHELNCLGNQIARCLRDLGCSVGDVVAIVMEKSTLLYAGILGIVKCGCSYLPLLPTTPTARIGVIFGQANVSVCLTDTDSSQTLEQLGSCRFLHLDEKLFGNYDESNLKTPADPSRVANIIYTSGSTGVPKGVCVTQLNITSNLDVLSRIYPVKEHSRLLQSCSQAFDVSVFEIFFAWTRGMCLCSAVNDTLFEDLERSIRKLGVTHLSMTPTVASLVEPAHVPCVEFLVTSGEPMTEAVARKWCRQLYQGYGPSETTNICTVKKMAEGDIIQHLGWSFENTSTIVLQRDGGNAVPHGSVGEFCFAGDQVVQGYLGAPELTEAKFINHPRFGRLYRSGDLGRMLPDGSLMIIGRADDQIKLRGQRIELGEINTVIGQSGLVSDCVTLVVSREGPSSDQLASFYTLQDGGDTLTPPEALQFDDRLQSINDQLLRLLASSVPAYMVPSYLVPISRVPVTTSGKLDRAWLRTAFRRLEQSHLASAASSVEDRHDDGQWTEMDRAVADIVCSSLSASPVHVRRWTPLASLGLDSISAISLSQKLRKQLGRSVPVSTILQNSCIARLARALENAETKGGRHSTKSSARLSFSTEFERAVRSKCHGVGRRVERILPCTPLQEAMLASSDTTSYLNKTLLRLHCDPDKIRRCWELECERQEILRTCFVTTDDTSHAIAQVVLEGWQPRWHSISRPEGTLDDCVSSHSERLTEAIDSLEPPVSFATIEHGGGLYLSFICHHALYDAVAIDRLLFEVEELVGGRCLPPAPSFEPFLREVLASAPGTDEFWRKQLGGFEPRPLPRMTGAGTGARKPTTWLGAVDTPLSQVNRRCREMGSSLLAICQVSWISVLGAVMRTDDVCFGSVVSGRSVAMDGINELVAPCFNTLPIRVRMSETKRNVDLMKTLQRLNLSILAHQFTPLRHIQPLVPRRSGHRLFETMLLLQQPFRPLDSKIWTIERDDGEMDVPLVCELAPDIQGDKLLIMLHYDSARFSNDFMTLISDLLQHAFSVCLDYPASHIPVSPNLPASFISRLERFDLAYESLMEEGTEQSDGDRTWSEAELLARSVLSSLSSVPEASIRHQTTIYQLGLDSINAVQIASRLRRHGLDVAASDVIENNTIERLALHLASRKTSPQPTFDLAGFQDRIRPQLAKSGIVGDVVEAILPCTSPQAGMLVQFVRSGGTDYFNFVDVRFKSIREASKLRDIWLELTRLHPILRTGFINCHDVDSPIAMVQYRSGGVAPPVVGLQDGEPSGFDVHSWRSTSATECVSLLREPLWRAACVGYHGGTIVHLAIHHALYDAQSLRRLLDDVERLSHGEALPASPPTKKAAVDILEQARSQTGSDEAFWRGQAQDIVVNKFPVLTPLREERRSILTASRTSPLLFSDMEKAVKAAGVTVQATLQAACARILSSYLGEASVTFGTVMSGRNSEATNDAVFPCITTLPVIARNEPSNRVLLDAMMKSSRDLYRHQHSPLTQIQRWLGHPDMRVFDMLLVYQRFGGNADASPAWEIVDEQASIDYPVSIEVEPVAGDQLVYRITFFDDVLPREQACLLLEQFDSVVSCIANQPDGHEDGLMLDCPSLFSMTPPENPTLPSEEKLLHQFVESRARRTPGKTALTFVYDFDGPHPVGKSWSYRELDDNGNRVAHMLLPHVGPGDIVAVYFDKCPEAFFAILGILKAGCAFLALDPGAPAARKEFIVHDSGACALLTSAGREEGMDWHAGVPVLTVSDNSLNAQPSEPVAPPREPHPGDVCYCLYTSGTTGTPKGCEITHENTVQAMLAFQEVFAGRWDESSKWLQFASFHFDVAVLEQYWSWSVGITLVGAPRDLILGDLAGVISSLQITHIDLTPSLARLLHPDEVPSLCRGVFITGGEQLKQEILDTWGSRGAIYNAYGPTEATIGVTTYPRVPKNGRSSNIGKQFSNVGSYVLRPGTEVPVFRGAVGELCLSGKLVGKGYLNRDDLTAERFPKLARHGERVYRTGDLVRMLHDGCFDFLGRADDQVKLRGQRLEIGEINHTVKIGVAKVVDVATLVARNESQQKDLLVSFAVTGRREAEDRELRVFVDGEALELAKLVQDSCRQRLPSYMVPTYVLELTHMPLSPNNKAEVKELKRLFSTMDPSQLVSLGGGSSGQLSSTGRRILNVFASAGSVDVSQAGPSTSIYELGIDSISVMRFSAALKRAGLTQSTPAVILQHPRLGDLAQALDSLAASSHSTTEPAARQLVQACYHRHITHVLAELGVEPREIEYVAPCSPLQEGIISRSGTEGMEGAYFNTFRLEISEATSIPRLQGAWHKVMAACSILRTIFVSTTDGHVQVSLNDPPLPWTEQEVGADEQLESVLETRRKSWVATNHDNKITRPLEFLCIKTPEKSLLVVHIFHALYDANSLDLMLGRVAGEYQGGDNLGHAPGFLEGLAHGPLRNQSACKGFWAGHLDGSSFQPFLCLAAQPNQAVTTSTKEISFDGLESVRRSLGVTHQSVVQAIWASVLRQISSTNTIGLVTSGRSMDLEGSENIVGPLFNTLPFHASVNQGDTWSSLIRKCHDFNVATLAFQHVPLRDIQKWCSSGRPLFDTLFSFQREIARPTHVLWKVSASTADPDFPLAFEATLTADNRLVLLLVAQAGVADEEALSGLLERVNEAAVGVAEDPDGQVTQCRTAHIGEPGPSVSGAAQQAARDGGGAADAAFAWTPAAELIRDQIAILAELPRENISATTSLLELGLDSIDAIKLSSRLRKAGLNIPTSQLMKQQTISAVVRHLREPETNGYAAAQGAMSLERMSAFLWQYLSSTGADLDGIEMALPATPLQDSMVAEMIQSDFRHYFNHDILELAPDVEVERLEAAWGEVVQQSPILRTSFAPIESSDFASAYCQLIAKPAPAAFRRLDIPTLSGLSRVSDSARERARKGSGRSHLLQLALVTVEGRRFLVLSISHGLYDGWSLALLHHDVSSAYNKTYSPRAPYGDLLCRLVMSSNPEARSFWSGYLGGATRTLLSRREVHHDDNDQQSPAINRAEATSSVPLSKLRAFSRRIAVSTHVLGQACWAALLATSARSLDITFGVVLSGRDTESAETLLFPTMNTIALRSILHGDMRGWLRYMQENMTNIAQFQHFPLREAQKLTGRRGGPLFNTLFINQRQSRPGKDDGEALMRSVEGTSALDYPVCVEMELGEDDLTWRVACTDTHFADVETSRLIQQLDDVLRFIISSSTDDVLVFDGDRVSVCGLPSFTIQQPPQATSEESEPRTTLAGDETSDWTEAEEKIRSILTEIAAIPAESIRKYHNIYHLGLDSISAIKASSLLRKKGLALTVRQLLGAESIAEMATMASTSDGAHEPDSGDAAVSLADVDVAAVLRADGLDAGMFEEILPATAMQVHMLSVWQNTGGRVFYPEFTYRLSGVAHLQTIASAWGLLVRGNPILRTRFSATGSRILPFIQLVYGWESCPASDIIGAGNEPSFSQPLVSLHVQPQGGDEWTLRLSIHHALYDGVSLPILIDSFRALCEDSSATASAGPATLDSAWKRALSLQTTDAERRERRAFWTEYLQGARAASVPARAAPGPPDRTAHLCRGAVADLSALQSLCLDRGVSLQAVAIGACACLLAPDGGGGDVVLGVYLARREGAGAERLACPTLCLVPLRVRAPAARGLAAVAEEVQRDLRRVSAPAAGRVGLWEVSEWTGLRVGCFVNFLSLPEMAAVAGAGRVRVQEVPVAAGGAPAPGRGWSGEPWERENVVRDAYLDAVDVEFSVRDGAMDIGVFGPGERLGHEEANGVVAGVVEVMGGMGRMCGGSVDRKGGEQ